jgi:AraC family transcriptional regulator of adaptative response / DNA-3-methyladenine glycosylase II
MDLPDFAQSYGAVTARDPRFDGRVFTAVRTTGIYCRPSCPARTPKAENFRFFASAAIARAAGFRACKRCDPDGAGRKLDLPVREPFQARELLDFFARRAVPGVEEVTGEVYRRSLPLARGAGVAELKPAGGRVELTVWLDHDADFDEAVSRCRGLLDLDADPDAVLARLGADELIGPLVREAPGRRVPGAADEGELAVRAVLGQQITVAAARRLAGRLVERCGADLSRPVGQVTRLFPTMAAIADGGAAALPMPAARCRAVQRLAGALADSEITLSANELLALPGIGPWTASYIAMRALRDRDVFLSSDVAVRRAAAQLGADHRPQALERLAHERWRPLRSYAVVHLWASLAAAARATVEVAA